MKERPILFNDEMVRAILEGRKTQTRRAMKPQPITYEERRVGNCFIIECQTEKGYFSGGGGEDTTRACFAARHCPYGEPGDRLWVREAFCELRPEHYHDRGPAHMLTNRYGPIKRNGCEYRAGTIDKSGDRERCREELGYKWTPSIHMPRWASRITLQITGVRVERVQEISEEDAKAEGAQEMHLDNLGQTWKTYQRGFESLWDSINSGDKSWAANPFVWVIEFRRVEG